jgi:hypothetical protein
LKSHHNGIADGFRPHATIHMMRKQQAKYACTRHLALAKQFHLLTARTSYKAPAISSILLRICDGTIDRARSANMGRPKKLAGTRTRDGKVSFVLFLDPDDHRWLKDEAKAFGIPLYELILNPRHGPALASLSVET